MRPPFTAPAVGAAGTSSLEVRWIFPVIPLLHYSDLDASAVPTDIRTREPGKEPYTRRTSSRRGDACRHCRGQG